MYYTITSVVLKSMGRLKLESRCHAGIPVSPLSQRHANILIMSCHCHNILIRLEKIQRDLL